MWLAVGSHDGGRSAFGQRARSSAGREVYAHRLILAASCEHFYKAFTSGCSEARAAAGRKLGCGQVGGSSNTRGWTGGRRFVPTQPLMIPIH